MLEPEQNQRLQGDDCANEISINLFFHTFCDKQDIENDEARDNALVNGQLYLNDTVLNNHKRNINIFLLILTKCIYHETLLHLHVAKFIVTL